MSRERPLTDAEFLLLLTAFVLGCVGAVTVAAKLLMKYWYRMPAATQPSALVGVGCVVVTVVVITWLRRRVR